MPVHRPAPGRCEPSGRVLFADQMRLGRHVSTLALLAGLTGAALWPVHHHPAQAAEDASPTASPSAVSADASTAAPAAFPAASAQAGPQTAASDQGQAESAQASGRLLEEIVVVAQKREQNIQNVGMAIDAFSGAQLDDFGIQTSMDVATISPGVHVAGSHAGQQLQFSIRGVVNNDFNPVVETPNAVYLDEAYIAALPGQNFGLFDIERVEILKGPQGTLFGRNATGGLIHYLSRQPGFDRWEGYVDGEFGLFDSPADAYGGRITAALGGPLSERVATRAAIYWKRHGGYLKTSILWGRSAARRARARARTWPMTTPSAAASSSPSGPATASNCG